MSSTLTGNKIKDSYQALLKIGTNGSLDPITAITISDGLGNDTPLQLSATLFKTKVVSANKDYGLQLDLSANSHIYLGDYNNQYNGTSLYLSDYNQLIQTYGLGGQSIGLKLDFGNNFYQFGDFNGIVNTTNLSIFPGSKIIDLQCVSNFLELEGNYNNVLLGPYYGEYDYNDGAVVGNYMFGTDWHINNSDAVNYLFQNNTILNCYNNIDTNDKAMSNNFFANITGGDLVIGASPSLADEDNISNCFIFGLDTIPGISYFGSYSPKASQTNTNVVLFNAKNINYYAASTNIFSVNSSGTFIEEFVSGVTILGGDYYNNNEEKLFKANHQIDFPETYCINITGIRAVARNSFSNVFATSFSGLNEPGQVQVEQIQLSAYVDNGSDLTALKNSIGNNQLYVQSSSTYQVEAKIVSTVGNGDKGTTGNCYINATWKVCVNNNGRVDIGDFCTGCQDNPYNSAFFELITLNDNYITLKVAPDNDSQNSCYVKALITLNCITTG